MPLTETELLARDATRNLGDELLQAIRDVKAGSAFESNSQAVIDSPCRLPLSAIE